MAALVCAMIIFGGNGSKIVGKNIKINDINDFYYTLDGSTNPPYFQRYRFYAEEGKYYFYHEKREGDHWPLTDGDITVSGTVELTLRQWQQFFEFIEGGKVIKRQEHLESGDSGPWLFLYWKNDKSVIQEFSFESLEKRFGFEDFCRSLRSE